MSVAGLGVGGEKSWVRLSQGRQGQTRLLSLRTSEDLIIVLRVKQTIVSSQNDIFLGS